MQMKRAQQLREEWGDKPCDHPTFAKEYDHGPHTGNYLCTQCGRSFSWREKTEIVAPRRPAP